MRMLLHALITTSLAFHITTTDADNGQNDHNQAYPTGSQNDVHVLVSPFILGPI